MKTKGQRFKEARRRIRRREKGMETLQEKMPGRKCRHGWGSGNPV